jgi:aminopeptidase N
VKRLIAFFLTLGVLTASCQFLTPKPLPPTPAPSAPNLPATRDLFREGLVSTAQPILDQLQGASEYELEFKINADLLHVEGKERVRYTNNEDVSLAEIRLRLFPNILGGEMHIPEVFVDGVPLVPNYSLNDSLLTVPLASALEPGQSVTLDMDFSLTVPDTVDLNYGVLASAEGVLALAHAYPMVTVYNEEGWNAELPPQSGDVTFADMSFFTVTISAPSDLVLVAVGRETSREVDGDTQVVTFAAGPVRDFYLAASADYEVTSRQVGETTIHFYAPPEFGDGARAGLDVAARAVEDYNVRYGLYPYTELDLVSTPTLALGIEYPGMIAITSRILEPEHTYLEGTVAHEIGHQWFYNLVGSDQLDHPWLDESLTQFVTLQYFEDEYGFEGYQGFRESFTSRWQNVDNQPIPIGLPVAGYSGKEYSAIIYGRGPLFFEALKGRMGAEAFDAFLRDYTETYSWDIATPEGLKSLAETHCGCDLTELFDEWVFP